ncbi:hypothetical protein KEM52_003089 [Ascosphaera acerosa]|nr:hypothetical protein KEM52_003089 [Ascosphaera acerosa]
MAKEVKNVIVIGGTGYIGKFIVQGLVKAGFNVSVLTRASKVAEHQFPEGVTPVPYEPDSKDSLVKAFTGQDVVVSALAQTALASEYLMIDAAVEAGVPRFLPSEYGTDPQEMVTRDKLSTFKAKKEVFDYLVKVAEEGKIEYTAFATGPFLDPLHLGSFWGFDLKTNTATAWDEKKADMIVSTTRCADVGDAVAKSLTPALYERFANQVVAIQNTKISLRTLLQAYEKLTGVQWTVQHVDLDAQSKAALERFMTQGGMENLIPAIKGVLLEPELERDWDHLTSGTCNVSDVLSVPQLTVEDVVKQVMMAEQ